VYAIHPAPLSETSILDTKAGRETMGKLEQLTGLCHTRRSENKPDQRSAAEKKENRRKFVKNMVATGHKIHLKTLKEFAGEAWADKAIKEAAR
jgi:hypothetical protein